MGKLKNERGKKSHLPAVGRPAVVRGLVFDNNNNNNNNNNNKEKKIKRKNNGE